MLGRKMKHMRMPRVAQKSPPLLTSAQVLGQKGHPAPLGNHTADVQTPVRVEIINHPIVALHSGQLLDDMGQMGRKIGAGSGLAQIPHDLPRWYHKRSKQRPCAVTDVLVLAFFRFPRFDALRGIFALKNLHTGLFIAANNPAALLKEPAGLEI